VGNRGGRSSTGTVAYYLQFLMLTPQEDRAVGLDDIQHAAFPPELYYRVMILLRSMGYLPLCTCQPSAWAFSILTLVTEPGLNLIKRLR
jgi:hypothetical protein